LVKTRTKIMTFCCHGSKQLVLMNKFVDGVIIPYLKRGHGNVHNKPPPGGMAA